MCYSIVSITFRLHWLCVIVTIEVFERKQKIRSCHVDVSIVDFCFIDEYEVIFGICRGEQYRKIVTCFD